MEKAFKFLVAAASLVVVIGGIYKGWGEWDRLVSQNTTQHIDDENAAFQQAKEERMRVLSVDECHRMANETLPDKLGGVPKTTKYNKLISECADLGRFDQSWRYQLDMAGVL